MKPNILSIKNLIVILAVVTLFSCSKQSDYLQSIPADANVVITLNPESLAKKGNITELLKNPKITEQQEVWLNQLSPESKELAEKIAKDPAESGVSLKSDIVYFSNAIESEIGLLLKLDNRKKFETFLSALSSEGGNNSEIKEENGCYFSEIDQKLICAFNDDKALFLFPFQNNTETAKLKKDAAGYLQQKAEKSLLSNKGFVKFTESNKDLNVWMSMAAIPSSTLKLYSSFLPANLKIGSIYSSTHIDFQKGKIVIESGSYSDDAETQKALENIASIMGKQSNSFLKQIPGDSWLVWSVNLNGEKLYNILMENPDFAAAAGSISGELNLQQLIGSIDGDLTMSLINVTTSGALGYSPDMVLFAKVKDDSILKVLKTNLQLAGITTLAENQYLISWGGMSIYFGMKDKDCLYVTTDKKVVDNLSSGLDSPFSKTPLANAFKSGGAMAINARQIQQGLPSELSQSSGFTDYKLLLALFSSAEMQSEGLSSKTIINMTNQSDNALTAIIKGLEEQIPGNE